jgi:hypothetical protein
LQGPVQVVATEQDENHAQGSRDRDRLGIAFGVAACGTDTKPGALPTTTPEATASPSPAPTSTARPGPKWLWQWTPQAKADAALKADLKNMATIRETYIVDHPNEMGVPVTATEPGGHATVIGAERFVSTPGNVIAVKVGPSWYCISGYNTVATEATSANKSMLYKSDQGGLQSAVGAC